MALRTATALLRAQGWNQVSVGRLDSGFWDSIKDDLENGVSLPIDTVVTGLIEAWEHKDGRVLAVTDGGDMLTVGASNIVWLTRCDKAGSGALAFTVGPAEEDASRYLGWLAVGRPGERPERGFDYMS